MLVVRLFLIAAIIAAATCCWWYLNYRSQSNDGKIYILKRNGYFLAKPNGLDPKRLAISLDIKTMERGKLIMYGHKNILQYKYCTLDISIDKDGKVVATRSSITKNKTTPHVIISDATVTDDEWHLISFEINGTVASLKINGTEKTAAWPESFDAYSTDVRIGGFSDYYREYWFSGLMRNIKFGLYERPRLKFIEYTTPTLRHTSRNKKTLYHNF